MRTGNENLGFSGTDLSTNQTSYDLFLSNIFNYSIQLVFTGSPVGTFKLQCSNDQGNPVTPTQTEQNSGVVHWTDVASSSTSVSGAGNILFDVQNTGYRWVRVVYTASSGSGTLTVARFNLKGI